MKLSLNRNHEHFTDENGQRCARVPLANTGQVATLYAEDLALLLEAGLPQNWSINFNCRGGIGYVRAKVPGDNTRTVARLIRGAAAGQQVAYRDGNRLNLCRHNLVLIEGGTARVDCAALLSALPGTASVALAA